MGLIPGQGSKIPCFGPTKKQKIKKKQKQYHNKYTKDFGNGPHQKIFEKVVRVCVETWIKNLTQLSAVNKILANTEDAG